MLRFSFHLSPGDFALDFYFVAGIWILKSEAILPFRFVESIKRCFNNLGYATLAQVDPNV